MPEAGGPRLRVVLAEDHYLVREGTRQLLEATGAVDVLAAVGSGPELLDAADRFGPDAVLTDIRMPPTLRTEGIQAAHAIRARQPAAGVVVLSQHADDAYAAQLFEHGSAGLGYLLKDRIGDHHQLVHALRETAAGRSVIDPLIVDGLVRRREQQHASGIERLTDREREVLHLMAEGWSNPAIAERTHLSGSSVEKNVAAIFAKLDLPPDTPMHRRVAAVVAYLRHSDRP